MCLAQRASYKRAVIARSESLISRTTRSSSLSWNKLKEAARRLGRDGTKKNEPPKQWLPKQKRKKRSSRQSQKRKQSKKQQNKRQKTKPSSKKWNNIYSVWLWKKRANGNGGVKICLKHWWNEKIVHCRIVFWADCYSFRKSLLICRRKSGQLLMLSRV